MFAPSSTVTRKEIVAGIKKGVAGFGQRTLLEGFGGVERRISAVMAAPLSMSRSR
jgi:hypothetical protein